MYTLDVYIQINMSIIVLINWIVLNEYHFNQTIAAAQTLTFIARNAMCTLCLS